MISKKAKLIEEANKKLLSENYGGGEYELPSKHKAALKVPKGGSCCLNCEYWNKDKVECTNEFYIKWNGDGKIPAPPDEFCSDWWESED